MGTTMTCDRVHMARRRGRDLWCRYCVDAGALADHVRRSFASRQDEARRQAICPSARLRRDALLVERSAVYCVHSTVEIAEAGAGGAPGACQALCAGWGGSIMGIGHACERQD